MLTLEFGEPKLAVREPVEARRSTAPHVRALLARRTVRAVGSWHLWIYLCHWRLLVDGVQVAWSEGDDTVLECAARTIDGQKLVGVEVDKPQGMSRFRFDLGACLETSPYPDGGSDEQWMLFTPDRQVLSFLPDGSHAWDTASESGECSEP